MGLLAGITVLDLSRMLPGPLCSWYLQGLGATVDRIEPLKSGDMTRSVPPYENGIGVFFSALNRGNRSCALNLRSPGGLSALRALVPRYDVLIEGFRPGVMEAMGFSEDALLELNPQLVVARISGFGQTGPWSHRPGHDLNYVGLAGIPNWGPDCAVPPAQIADTAGAQVAAMGISAALYGREKSGKGQILDVSLAEAALGVMAPHIAMVSREERKAIGGGEFLSGGLPTYGTFECKDGKWLTVGALEPKFQSELMSVVGGISRPELVDTFRSRTRDEWCVLLERACVGPSLEPGELASHPQHVSRGAAKILGRTTFIRPPFSSEEWHEGEVPALGAHTKEMLTDAGVSEDEIACWLAESAIGTGS